MAPANPPAFPRAAGDHGMTLRDWFAGQALVGMGNWAPAGPPIGPGDDWDQSAKAQARKAAWAYATADAMLARRAKGGAR